MDRDFAQSRLGERRVQRLADRDIAPPDVGGELQQTGAFVHGAMQRHADPELPRDVLHHPSDGVLSGCRTIGGLR